jgi:hypothetical protein
MSLFDFVENTTKKGTAKKPPRTHSKKSDQLKKPKKSKDNESVLPDGWFNFGDRYMQTVLVKNNNKPILDKNKNKQYVRRFYMK